MLDSAPMPVSRNSGRNHRKKGEMIKSLDKFLREIDEGDWAVLTRNTVEIFDREGKRVERAITKSVASSLLVDKGNHRHFMLKEIHEQPAVIGDTLQTYLDPATRSVTLPALPFDWTKVSRITMTACGTAWLANETAGAPGRCGGRQLLVVAFAHRHERMQGVG